MKILQNIQPLLITSAAIGAHNFATKNLPFLTILSLTENIPVNSLANAAIGGLALHFTKAVGTQIVEASNLLFDAKALISTSFNIAGCIIQAHITGKTTLAGFARGVAYEVMGKKMPV